MAGQRGEYHFEHFLKCLYSVSVDNIGILHVRSFGFWFFSGTVQVFSFMSRRQKKKRNVQISWSANALIFAQPTPHLHPSVYQNSSSTHMVPGSWQNYQFRCLPRSFLRSHEPRTGLRAWCLQAPQLPAEARS